jgi:O-antigen/teichoic acid export membrane protein
MIRRHRSLVGNTALSILGQVLPALTAIVVLPLLARTLGNERLGFLSLVWIVIGYFSLLDFGLGLGVTKSVAAAIGTGATEKIPTVFWTAWMTQFSMGCVGGLLLGVFAHPLAVNVLRVPGRRNCSCPQNVRDSHADHHHDAFGHWRVAGRTEI